MLLTKLLFKSSFVLKTQNQTFRYEIELLIAPIALRHFSEAPPQVLKKRMQLKAILKFILFIKKIKFFIYNYDFIKIQNETLD